MLERAFDMASRPRPLEPGIEAETMVLGALQKLGTRVASIVEALAAGAVPHSLDASGFITALKLVAFANVG